MYLNIEEAAKLYNYLRNNEDVKLYKKVEKILRNANYEKPVEKFYKKNKEDQKCYITLPYKEVIFTENGVKLKEHKYGYIIHRGWDYDYEDYICCELNERETEEEIIEWLDTWDEFKEG